MGAELVLAGPDRMLRSASLSHDGRYRFELTREWDRDRASVLFIMLNPSTADAKEDDPTIRRCIGFARCWGFGKLVVANLSPLRATNPDELLKHRHDRFAWQANRGSIKRLAEEAAMTVLAWGAHKAVQSDGWSVSGLTWNLPIDWREARCLGMTKRGHPKHPLYVAAATPPLSWAEEFDRSLFGVARDGR
jgi:hypothetical protein